MTTLQKVAFEGRFQYWSMEKLNKHTCVDCLTVSTKKLSNFRGQGQPGNITAVIDRHLLLQYLLKFRFDCPICEHLSNRNIVQMDSTNSIFTMCGSIKYPYLPHGRSLEIPRGKGV